MKTLSTMLTALVATVVFAVPTMAGPITDYVVYGGNEVSIGSNSGITGGLIGTGDKLSVGSGSAVTGLRIGGTDDFNSGSNLVVTGNIIGAGTVSLGSGSSVSGSISAGNKAYVKSGAVVTGNVTASNSVSVSSNAQVGGNINSGNKVTISSGGYVGGDITASGSISPGRNAVVIGLMTDHGNPTDPASFVAPGLPVASSFGTGRQTLSTHNGDVTLLDPGSYGTLDLANNNTLTLSAGEYYFKNIDVGNGLTLNLNLTGGGVAIFVDGNASFGTNLATNVFGGASYVYTEAHGNWSMGNNGTYVGTVFATDNIDVGENGNIFGVLYANDKVHLGSNTQVCGTGYTSAETGVPEPATMALLGLGLGAMAVTRRARRRGGRTA